MDHLPPPGDADKAASQGRRCRGASAEGSAVLAHEASMGGRPKFPSPPTFSIEAIAGAKATTCATTVARLDVVVLHRASVLCLPKQHLEVSISTTWPPSPSPAPVSRRLHLLWWFTWRSCCSHIHRSRSGDEFPRLWLVPVLAFCGVTDHTPEQLCLLLSQPLFLFSRDRPSPVPWQVSAKAVASASSWGTPFCREAPRHPPAKQLRRQTEHAD